MTTGFSTPARTVLTIPPYRPAIAVLLHHGIERDKIDHGSVQADFSGELINRRKIFPARMKSLLSDMQFIRSKADYTDKHISMKIAGRMLIKLKEMVDMIEKEVTR